MSNTTHLTWVLAMPAITLADLLARLKAFLWLGGTLQRHGAYTPPRTPLGSNVMAHGSEALMITFRRTRLQALQRRLAGLHR
jgi:hypothetical protein